MVFVLRILSLQSLVENEPLFRLPPDVSSKTIVGPTPDNHPDPKWYDFLHRLPREGHPNSPKYLFDRLQRCTLKILT